MEKDFINPDKEIPLSKRAEFHFTRVPMCVKKHCTHWKPRCKECSHAKIVHGSRECLFKDCKCKKFI